MISILLYILSFISFFYALAPIYKWGFVSFGSVILFILGILLFIIALFIQKIFKFKRKVWFKSTVIFLVLCLIYTGTLLGFMVKKSSYNNPPDSECTLIVLGCQVIGEYPSLTLAKRLEAAKKYLDENHKANCIVSGGKGADEIVTESSVMKKWLMQNGISDDRITEENKSTSTKENLEFSYDIINNPSQNIVIVTDGFHQLRAGLYFKQITRKNAYSISSKTPALMVPVYYARELLALQKAFIEILT